MSDVMNRSDEVKELFSALSKAQADIKGAVKDSANPFFKSNYADLASVWDACRVPLAKNGLCVIQTTEVIDPLGICIITTLGHASGQFIRSMLPIMAAKQDPQGIGSAISYARRYALAAMVGVFQVDDDAEGATNRGAQQQNRQEQPAPRVSQGPGPAKNGTTAGPGIAREKPMTRVDIGNAITKECNRIKCDPIEQAKWVQEMFQKEQHTLSTDQLAQFLAVVQKEATPEPQVRPNV